jgi:hypothetical protein
MKKTILIVAALIVAFAVLLPFASKTPDGLQALTENSASQQRPIWNGLMAEYSVALADPYMSTLAAGLLGVGIVLAAGFALGTTLTQKKSSSTGEQL